MKRFTPEEEVLYHQKESDLVQKNYSWCSISELGTDFFFWKFLEQKGQPKRNWNSLVFLFMFWDEFFFQQ